MPEVVGRKAELDAARRFLDAIPSSPCALVLEGEAGIGKTTLWNACIRHAEERSFHILRSRPAEPEQGLPFTTLADLLGGVVDDVLDDLPDPQRHALEVALLRVEPEGRPTMARTVSAGALAVVTALAAQRPVVLAVDDVQWADRSSADVLAFVARRLGSRPIGLLTASRLGVDPPDPLGLAGAFDPACRWVVPLRGLDRSMIAELVLGRLGWDPPHPVLAVISERSGGNPFFALELARAALEGGGALDPAVGVLAPEDLAATLHARVARLSADAREVLLTASATGSPTIELLERCISRGFDVSSALTESTLAGLVDTRADLVSFTHPLYASAIYGEASKVERIEVHTRLAAAAIDLEERARHLALSTSPPDPAAARVLEDAARHARGRGAEWTAAELCRLAADLVPGTTDAERLEATAADDLFRAGDRTAATRLLRGVIDRVPNGGYRAELLVRLGQQSWQDDLPATVTIGQAALAETGASIRTRVKAHILLAQAFSDLCRQAEVRRELHAAIETARSAGDHALLTHVLATAAFLDPPPQLDVAVFERAERLTVEGEYLTMADRPIWNLAFMLVAYDRLDEARPIVQALIDEARDAGDEPGQGMAHMVLGTLEERAGNLEASRHHYAEMRRLGTWAVEHPMAAYVDALVGDLDAARWKLEHAGEGGEAFLGTGWMASINGVRGFVAMSDGKADEAADAYARAWETLLPLFAEMRAPAFHYLFAADAVEALVRVSHLAQAEAITERTEQSAVGLQPCLPQAIAHRARGLILAATGDLDTAIAELVRAKTIHDYVPVPFERARTLLVLGSVRRRAKQKRAARDDLLAALAIFERIGTPLWAGRARRELASIAGRGPRTGALTPTEDRVARLAAAGRTNREIADELFLSARTVETHLSHTYRKLGVRSRTELVSALEPAAST